MKNRSIKFQAYSKSKKIIAKVSKIDLLTGKVWTLKPNGEERKKPWEMVDIVLMQFTGLDDRGGFAAPDDRKGLEIYEGHIVRVKDVFMNEWMGYIKMSSGIWFVEYAEPRYDKIKNCMRERAPLAGFWTNNFVEIVGTVAKTPELLEIA